MIEFDATVKQVSDVRVHVSAPDGTTFFWLFGVPYVVTAPGAQSWEVATLSESERLGLITLS